VPPWSRRLGVLTASALGGAVALGLLAAPAGVATSGEVGDLRLVDAWMAGRLGDEVAVHAKVRNVGTTARDLPAVTVDGAAIRCTSCQAIPPGRTVIVGGAAWAPNALPRRIAVSAEGPDATPADNEGPLAPRIGLSAPTDPAWPSGGIRLRVGLAMPGTLKLRATVAGLSFGRTLTFAHHAHWNIVLAPRSAADRARLRKAMRAEHRLPARVTATDGGFPHHLYLIL
jgi:hypothetical protein